jgi:Lon protease-like protein
MASMGPSENVRELPLFPLGAVLFPGGTLPLHIFEQRYRQMIARCLEQSPPEFVVVLLKEGDEVVELPPSARPPRAPVPHPIGTVARITQAGKFPDGRFLIVCSGGARVRLRRLVAEVPYLEGEVVALEERDGLPADQLGDTAGRVREGVTVLLTDLLSMLPSDSRERRRQLRALAGSVPANPAELSYFVPRVLFTSNAAEQQRLLEAEDAATRLALELPLLAREREMARRAGALARHAARLNNASPASLN